MGGAWLERTLRFGRTKKISEVFKQRKDPAKRMKDKRGNTEKLKETSKVDPRPEKKRDRKLYPLRGRAGTSEADGLSCHVLLTRLEESIQEKRQRSTDRERKDVQPQRRGSHKAKHRKGKSGEKKEKSSPKTQSKLKDFSHGVHMVQPRKRRLASLNAEAVNSLLLERATDPQPPTKQPRRLDDLPGGVRVYSDGDSGQGVAPGVPKVSRGNVHRTSMPCKLEAHQSSSSKQARKSKAVREGRVASLSQESLDAPAPRRLAGLNAAALLKLTSSSASSKQRAKATPSAAIVVSECRGPTATASQHNSRVKQKNQVQKQKGKARRLY